VVSGFAGTRTAAFTRGCRANSPGPGSSGERAPDCRDGLDWLLVSGRRHLERVLQVIVEHYTSYRPHRALAWQRLMSDAPRSSW
jgi:hypothetical protein